MEITLDHFDPKEIADSGQCFRFNEIAKDKYTLVALDRYLEVKTLGGNRFSFSCDEKEWDLLWRDYFDECTDYAEIARTIREHGDAHLKEAFALGSGIRILKQDLFEVIVSFLISQNNNIKRIKASIEAIAIKAHVPAENNENAFRFPHADDVSDDFFDDRSLGLGYRDIYLKEIYRYVRENPGWLDMLKTLSYEDARAELLKRKGIGPKVADCICLFGLHHTDAFPVDTHVRQLLDRYYPEGFDNALYKGFRGIIQQYLFYYELTHSK